jgi:hypothetical protein
MTPQDRIIRWAADHGNREARRLVESKEEARKRRSRRHAPSRAEKRKEEELEGQVNASVYTAVIIRAGATCELCGGWLSGDTDPAEIHHLNGRSDTRPESLMRVHASCHRAYHTKPSVYAPRVERWCEVYGYPLPDKVWRLKVKAEHAARARRPPPERET